MKRSSVGLRHGIFENHASYANGSGKDNNDSLAHAADELF
jgi:hypothetical protein